MKNELNYKTWNYLLKRFDKYGISALTTFYAARYDHSFGLSDCFKLMRMQVNKLGADYAGGLDCVPFRGKERIKKILS